MELGREHPCGSLYHLDGWIDYRVVVEKVGAIMQATLRRVRIEDKARVIQIEEKATPNLRYLGTMFEHWVHDDVGEFCVAEVGNKLVGVGKLTILYDGSAWLEALRVIPEVQRQGIGKKFYRRFFDLAEEKRLPTMRMYTGIKNQASKGLAEKFGLRVTSTCKGASCRVNPSVNAGSFRLLRPDADGLSVDQLCREVKNTWGRFCVMNRTFYEATPDLVRSWLDESKLYSDPEDGTFLSFGARFQADLSLHVGFIGGNFQKALDFANAKAVELGVPSISCLYPAGNAELEEVLHKNGWHPDPSDYLVMEVLREDS